VVYRRGERSGRDCRCSARRPTGHFVGAGASVRAPSGLPLFDMLVNRVADDLGFAPYLASKHHSPDAYLEEIERRLEGRVPSPRRPMRERVVAQLTGAPSSPNDVHEAIVRLFPQADKVRIVTTNYDRHLETAAAEAFSIAPNIYRAPALREGTTSKALSIFTAVLATSSPTSYSRLATWSRVSHEAWRLASSTTCPQVRDTLRRVQPRRRRSCGTSRKG